MKIKKSQLKEAVKAVVRQCLNERVTKGCGSNKRFKGKEGRMFKHVEKSEKEQGKSTKVAKKIAGATVNKKLKEQLVGPIADEGMGADSKQTPMDDIVKFVMRKVPAIANNPQKVARVAGLLFQHQYGGQPPDPDTLLTTVQKHMRAVPNAPGGDEQTECGSMQDEAGLTSETDGHEDDYKGNEGDYIGGNVPGTKGKNRFVSQGQLDALRRDKADPRLQPHNYGKQQVGEDENHDYDEREEIVLIKVMALIAKKLEAMHAGMPGAGPSDEPSDVTVGGEEEPTEEPSFGGEEEPEEEPSAPPFGSGEEEPTEKPSFGGEEEPEEEPSENPEKSEKTKEPKKDKKKDPSLTEMNVKMRMGPSYKTVQPRQYKVTEPDQTGRLNQFDPKVQEAAKKMKENYKVQARSYVTYKDNPNDPNVMRDPENPGA